MIRKSEATIAATEYAREYSTNEEKRAAFCAGVVWTIENLERHLRPDHYEDIAGYPHKYMEELTLKDLRKMFFEWTALK